MLRTLRPASLSASSSSCLFYSYSVGRQPLASFHSSAVSLAFKVRGRPPQKSYSGGRSAPKLGLTKFGNASRTRLAKDIRPEPHRRAVSERSSRDGDLVKPQEEQKEGGSSNARAEIEALLDEEFDRSPVEPLQSTPRQFLSPPLLPALRQSTEDILGRDAVPTPIQALALQEMFTLSQSPNDWKQFLLASETGSGKSIAYLLPLLQHLKETEGERPMSRLPTSPRALVLAPTHELSRQLASTAKSLLHHAKLRVQCASRANTRNGPAHAGSARQLKQVIEGMSMDGGGASEAAHGSRPIDLLTSTPTKALEMVRGWGWDRVGKAEFDRDGKPFRAGKPEMSLKEITCVVIDEADILFDTDFRETTLALLSDISAARGQKINGDSSHIKYPFHLILTSATIPNSMSSYLTKHHPALKRLASPNVHRLPDNLYMEHVRWTGVNRYSDIEKRLRRVWAEDALRRSSKDAERARSRVLIFCNRTGAVDALSSFLEQKGVPNVALTKTAKDRTQGSNRHLTGFLKGTVESAAKDAEQPHVLITTSLLSRGLDFDPSVQHVFIVDTPRNMIDFIHRAGRAGRMGNQGKVVVFGKLKGRGSAVDVETKRKLQALKH